MLPGLAGHLAGRGHAHAAALRALATLGEIGETRRASGGGGLPNGLELAYPKIEVGLPHEHAFGDALASGGLQKVGGGGYTAEL